MSTTVRDLIIVITAIETMRHGLKLMGEGYEDPAYLPYSLLPEGGVSRGDTLTGNYEKRDGSDGRYAHITAVSDIKRAPRARNGRNRRNSGSNGNDRMPVVRSLDRRVDRIESTRFGRTLDLGHDDPAHLLNSVYDGEITVGDRIVGTYKKMGGDKPYAQIVKVESVMSADESADAKTVEAIGQTVLEITATSGLSGNNRFSAVASDGSRVVVQAAGRCVMYARSLAKDGAKLMVTGAENSGVSGQASLFFDAVRVDKA